MSYQQFGLDKFFECVTIKVGLKGCGKLNKDIRRRKLGTYSSLTRAADAPSFRLL